MKQTIRNWIAGVLVLASLAGLAGLARGTTIQNTSAVQSGPSFEEVQIQELRALLTSSQLSEEGRKSIQGKLEMAERMAAERQANQMAQQAGPRTKLLTEAMRLAPEPQQNQAVMEGIIEGSEGLVRPSLAVINNMWQGERGGSMYQVFAGSLPEQPEQGLLIVVMVAVDRPTGDQQVYIAPQGSGALRILSVDDMTLLLEGDSGSKLSFDLLSQTFQE